jgi:glycosyltransferase involved in cell wall biosynthesis
MSLERKIPRVMDLLGTYKGGGGPDKTVLNSAAQHDPEKVYVLVTYLRQPRDDEFQIPEMARRLGINYVDLVDRNGIDWQCLSRLKGLLREHRLEVIHAHDDKTLLYGWLLRLMLPGVRIMYTCHSHALYQRGEFSSLSGFLRFKLRQSIQLFLMRRYAAPILTISGDTRRRLIGQGLAPGGVQVLRNGIDLRVWRRQGARPVLREELGLDDDELLVGTVARITHDKDIPTFLKVAQRVSARMPRARFVVVGDGYGDELARARAEAERMGLTGSVIFTGHRNDLLDLYASFDIFLMTSVTEGMPNTLLEAMALGVPCVATVVGGVPEVLAHGAGGFLAPPGESEELAREVLRLLEDRPLRESFGLLCRARIEAEFSFGKRVSTMERYYEFFAGLAPCPCGVTND